MSDDWPITTTVYMIVERVNGSVRIRAVFSQDAVEEALDWGSEEYDEFHAADPGRDNCAFLKKCHGVDIDLR